MSDRGRFWAGLLSDWKRSGVSQAEFCRRRGIKAVTFAWWKRRLPASWGDPVQSDGRAKDRFVEVQLPGLVSMSAYEIVLAHGRSIRVGSQFDPEVLTRLIAAVESC